MAELHIVGEISGAHSFNGKSFFCVYEIVSGVQWSHVEGRLNGSTHIMENSYDGICWNLPIDVHYCFQSIQGWPKISLQVWSLDEFGRKDLAGYGTCFVPMPSAEEQEIEIPTWKPSYWYPNGLVRLYQQVRQMVMGGNPVLRDDSLVHTNDARYKLHTVAGGNVTLKLNVISRRTAALGLRGLWTGELEGVAAGLCAFVKRAMFTVYIAAESLMTLLPLGTRVARVAVPANARGAPILRSVKLFGTIRGLLTFPFATFFLKYIRHWAKVVVFSFHMGEPVLRMLLEAAAPDLHVDVVSGVVPPSGQPRHVSMLGIKLSDFFQTLLIDVTDEFAWNNSCRSSLLRVRHDLFQANAPEDEEPTVSTIVASCLASRALLFAAVAVRRVDEIFASTAHAAVSSCMSELRHSLFYGCRYVEPLTKECDVPDDFWFDLLAHGAAVARVRAEAPDDAVSLQKPAPDASWVAHCIAALFKFPEGFSRDSSLLDHALLMLATAPIHPLSVDTRYYSKLWSLCNLEEPPWPRLAEAVAGSVLSIELTPGSASSEGTVSCRPDPHLSERLPPRKLRNRDRGTCTDEEIKPSAPSQSASSRSSVAQAAEPPLQVIAPTPVTPVNTSTASSSSGSICPPVRQADPPPVASMNSSSATTSLHVMPPRFIDHLTGPSAPDAVGVLPLPQRATPSVVVKVEPGLKAPPPLVAAAAALPAKTVSAPVSTLNPKDAKRPSLGGDTCLLQLSALQIVIKDKKQFLAHMRKQWASYIGHGVIVEGAMRANNDILVAFDGADQVDELMTRDPPLMLDTRVVPIVPIKPDAAVPPSSTTTSAIKLEAPPQQPQKVEDARKRPRDDTASRNQQQLDKLSPDERAYLISLLNGTPIESIFEDPNYFSSLRQYALNSLAGDVFRRNRQLCLSIVEKLGGSDSSSVAHRFVTSRR